MPNPNPTNTYETRDLWLSAALMAGGRRLLGLAWRGGRAYFVFHDLAACEETAEAYWRRDLRVVAKDFTDSLRTLKDRLHGGSSGGIGRERRSGWSEPDDR